MGSKLPGGVMASQAWEHSSHGMAKWHAHLVFSSSCDYRGEYALAEYTEVKTVTIKLDDRNPWGKGELLLWRSDSWMWQIKFAEEKNYISDLPGMFSSGDFKSTGFEPSLFSSHTPVPFTNMLDVKLQPCLGMEPLAISVFPFVQVPGDSEEAQSIAKRKWWLE